MLIVSGAGVECAVTNINRTFRAIPHVITEVCLVAKITIISI
jgi:hypothetical protein